MSSSAENASYHRSNLIKSYEIVNDEYGPYLDYFGSSYSLLFNNSVKRSTPYTLKQKDRLDLLSYTNYGTTSLWWAIAMYNPSIFHPLILTVGQIINIPSKIDIDSFLLSYKSGQVNSSNVTVQI